MFLVGGKRRLRSRAPEMNRQPAVYILASIKNGTLHAGVTANFVKRIWEHKNNLTDGFSNRYGVHHLPWYEIHEIMDSG